MKNVLKILLCIVFGVVVGSVATGLLLNKFHKRQLAEFYCMEVGSTALAALQLRQGLVEIVTSAHENSLPNYVLAINSDPDLRNANTADVALSAVKEYYVCTKTEIPKEIADIMDKVKEMPCNGPDE